MRGEPEATAAVASPALAWRPWAGVFAGVVAAAAAVLWGARRTPGHHELEVLATLLLYMSVACTFVPLPTAWIVLWAAREVGPLPVALVATIGTCMANLHDYYIVSGLCRVGRLQRARQGRAHARAVGWFRRAPFLALAAASFVPISVDVVRLLAISAGYSRRAYVLATFAGRLPRYALLALLGYELQPSNRTIAAVVAAMVLVAAGKGALDLVRARARRSA